MGHVSALVDDVLGLSDFVVTAFHENELEVIFEIETIAERVLCDGCSSPDRAHERRRSAVRDLPCCGRPTRLIWNKRRWRCENKECKAKSWTEESKDIPPRALLTVRAGMEVTRQVGEYCRSVVSVATEYGVCWSTVMNALHYHGTPLVDDPGRVGAVHSLGVDETAFLKATRSHHTTYVTSLVDLGARKLIDIIPGHGASDLRRWSKGASRAWMDGICVVATDLTDAYRAGMDPHLSHAKRVADPFHVIRVGNRCLDEVRRRVQHETTGHRGRKSDPLYSIRKLLLMGSERLDESGHSRLLLGLRRGDPEDQILGAWLAKESLREVYLTRDPKEAALLLDKAITGCVSDEVPEIRSLGRTLSRWRSEILAYHDTRASNGPTEGLNLLIKKVKRAGHGFVKFEHYRLRILLHAGGVNWPHRPHPPRIRARAALLGWE